MFRTFLSGLFRMKWKLILAVLAVCLFLIAYSEEQPDGSTAFYEHVNFVSEISQEDCFLCGAHSDPLTAALWEQDNIGIIDLNTFEMTVISINRYDEKGALIKSRAGYLQSDGMNIENGQVYSMTDPDRGWSHVQIWGAKHAIDAQAVQNRLCQTCLDTINDLHCGGRKPWEIAVIHFSQQKIRPLIACFPWFMLGDFSIDCEFKDNGDIALMVHYCPLRYD